MSACPFCRGEKSMSTTTFTADIGSGIVVVRDVPALLCAQCGEEWIDDNTAVKLEKLVQDAKSKHVSVEITTWTQAA